MNTMTTRERFQAVMNFQPFDRLPILEWASWWNKTLDRWHTEGLPADLTGRYDICRHFGLDVYKQDWFPVRGPDCPKPPYHGAGILRTEQEYDRLRQHLYPSGVIDKERWQRWAEGQERGDLVLWFTLDGFFWFPRTLLGIEHHLYAFYDQPALMHRINSDLTEWLLSVIDELCTVCAPDFMTFAEDMSYNQGSMLSKDLFDEFMAPYYSQVIPVLDKHGIIPIVDSDGDISVPLSWFERAGVRGILPLERQAGVDVPKLRSVHPKALFVGHFDKMTMNRGEATMRA